MSVTHDLAHARRVIASPTVAQFNWGKSGILLQKASRNKRIGLPFKPRLLSVQ